MAEKKGDSAIVAYLLGVLSIVMALFLPLSGIILGIVGLFHIRKKEGAEVRKAKKLNILGIILGVVLFVAIILVNIYYPL